MIKLIVLFLISLLGNQSFEVREFAHNSLISVGSIFNIEDEIIDSCVNAKDMEIKSRLYDIFTEIPEPSYPVIYEVARFSNEKYYGYIDPGIYLELNNNDARQAGECAIVVLMERFNKEKEDLDRESDCKTCGDEYSKITEVKKFIADFKERAKTGKLTQLQSRIQP